MKTFRLIRSHPGSAAYNMSLDGKIFSRYLEDGIPVFRVYGWSAPSFTYGVSQTPDDDLDRDKCKSDGVGVAKRMTGGGILLHGDEVTYGFVCSKDDVGEPKGVLISYREICAFLIKFYTSLGLKASFAIAQPDFKEKCAPHKLCSASHEKYDIVVNGKKIGGNAQKRSRSVIFQHGSIPIAIDWDFACRYIKSLPAGIRSGVTDLSSEIDPVPGRNTLEENLLGAFSAQFGVTFSEESESIYETSLVK